MAVHTYTDEEFGDIAIHRLKTARHIKIGVHVNGQLRATMPPKAPKLLLKRLVHSSRDSIRLLLEQSAAGHYKNGDPIGKSHALLIASGQELGAKKQQHTLVVTLPAHLSESSPQTQQFIRQEVIKILRKEAKAYLPKRLEALAREHGYSYEKVRLSHASTRWGSCSSSGTISLNIALMKLPYALIDYVLIHELCHTRELNHSDRFWQLVHSADPSYKTHMKTIKSHSPTI